MALKNTEGDIFPISKLQKYSIHLYRMSRREYQLGAFVALRHATVCVSLLVQEKQRGTQRQNFIVASCIYRKARQ